MNIQRFSELTSQYINKEKSQIIWNALKFSNQNMLAFYSYVARISKFINFNASENEEDIRNLGLVIPNNVQTIDFLFDFQIYSLYTKEEILPKLINKFRAEKTLIAKFFDSIDTRNKGKIFGYELFTWIDLIRICITNKSVSKNIILLPFSSNENTAKSLQQSLKIIASDLDFNNKSTSGRFKNLETLKILTLNNLITCFQEIPESNARELYMSLNIFPSGILYYHLIAVIESYRIQLIPEEIPEPIMKYSARDSKVSIQEAKLKLKSYIMGDNPKKRQLTPKEIFGTLDKNGDGIISSEEFMSGLDMIRLNLNANEKIILTKEVDKNRDDRINYEEIMSYLTDNEMPAYNIIGIDNSLSSFKEGSLDQAIFKLKLYIKNNPTGLNTLENVFQRLDEDKSGGLNDVEFDISLERLKLSFNSQQKKGLKQIAVLNNKGEIVYKSFCKIICDFQFEAKSVRSTGNANREEQVSQNENIFNYEIMPTKDYFTGSIKNCTTILNSEEAALKRCSELYKGCSKFIDPDFGPEKGNSGDICLYWNGGPPNSNSPPASELKWKSPSEWLSNVGFFKGGISSNDVVQGSLGDCWFIGALSVLAQRDELVRGSVDYLLNESQITKENALGLSKGVYPPLFHYFSKKGLYVFRFILNCKWRWVIIDDRLPIVEVEGRHPQYVFAHCKDASELWVSLIEKAYAKLYGCYQALNGGLIDDALVDLTGYVAEKTKVSINNPEEAEKLWASLKNYRSDRCLMGCSIDAEGVESDVIWNGEATGLLARHAYAIIDALQISDPKARKKRHRLIRLRNPWGQREWLGKWSDGSPEILANIEVLQQELKKIGSDEDYNPSDNNDGSFLMCYKDWRSLYHNLYACVDFSSEWWGVRFSGEWNPSNSGGVPTSANRQDAINWAKNPQYIIELKNNAEVFINLTQEDGRSVKDSVFPFDGIVKTACFTIMKLGPKEESVKFFDQAKIVKLSVLKLHRTIEIRQDLLPGKYCIIPATIKPGQTGNFWLSIYLNCVKSNADIYSAGDKLQGEIIEEEEEYSPDNLTPRLFERIKALIRTITSLR